MENEKEFNWGYYGTRTTPELLKIAEQQKFKGYEYMQDRKGNEQNFFIWKKKGKSEYIRVVMQSLADRTLFYWNLETSFKPFAYKHNHRENANIKSQCFKSSEHEKYISEFLKIIIVCKEVLKK